MEKDTAALGGRKRSRFGEQMPQHAIPPPQVASGDAAALASAPPPGAAAATGAPTPATGAAGGAMTPGMYLQVRKVTWLKRGFAMRRKVKAMSKTN